MRLSLVLVMAAVGCSLPEDGLAPDDAALAHDVAPFEASSPDADATTTIDAMDEEAAVVDVVDEPVVTAGDALQFTSGSYVNVGALAIPADFTIEAWIHPSSENGETYIVAEDRNGQAAGQLRFGLSAGKLFFMMSDASGASHGLYANGYLLQSAQAIATGTWTHVAVTKSGAAFSLFVGNVPSAFNASASFAYGGPPTAFRIAARVGSDGSSADGAFDGAIDEVRVWNSARTASEIAQTASTTVSPSSPGLIAYWRFDDGSGTTASDQENGHPGTLVKSPAWLVSTAF